MPWVWVDDEGKADDVSTRLPVSTPRPFVVIQPNLGRDVPIGARLNTSTPTTSYILVDSPNTAARPIGARTITSGDVTPAPMMGPNDVAAEEDSSDFEVASDDSLQGLVEREASTDLDAFTDAAEHEPKIAETQAEQASEPAAIEEVDASLSAGSSNPQKEAKKKDDLPNGSEKKDELPSRFDGSRNSHYRALGSAMNLLKRKFGCDDQSK